MSLPATYVEGFHEKEKVLKMPYRPLGSTGMMVSLFSLGASSLGSVYRSTSDEEGCAVVVAALKAGVNLIDVAPWYGHGKAERVLGMALKHVPREAYYLITKVCRYEKDYLNMFDFSAKRVEKSIDESLARMNVSYVDILQVHDMEFAANLDTVIKETIPAMIRAKEAGKTRFVGITGYPLENFRTVINAFPPGTIASVLTYCHYSLNDTTLLDYLAFFAEHNIGVINASAISMGLLSDRGPPKWHPASDHIKAVCAAAAAYTRSVGLDLAELAFKFSIAHPDIPTCLTSTASVDNVHKNIRWTIEPLTSTQKECIAYLDEHFFQGLKGQETWDSGVADYWAGLQRDHKRISDLLEEATKNGIL